MQTIKYALCLGVAAGVLAFAMNSASATSVTIKGSGNTDATNTKETIRDGYKPQVTAKGAVITSGSTPGDVKTSTDDNGAQPAEAPNEKVGTVPGEATPGDVKTSTDDNGAQPAEAPHDKAVVK